MGYPVAQYRPTRASESRGGFQKPSTKPGTILGFPRAASDAKKRRELQRERKGKAAPRVEKRSPGTMRAARLRQGRRDLTLFAQRQALQRQALSGIKFGIRFRAILFRSVAAFVLQRLMDWGRGQMHQKPLGLQKHPGWTFSGRAGLYPFCSGQTSAHTNGQYVGHNSPPTVFGHPWGGVPFDWAEYDAVDVVENPTTHALSYWFTQVGRGDQGTGTNPNTYYAGIRNLPQPFDQYNGMKNPWGLPYNPSWNRQPGRWPEGFPKPADLPLPSGLDDFSWGVYAPSPMPQPLPFALIPHIGPNPYRAPNEQSQRGPTRWPSPNPTPIIETDPFWWPDLIQKPRPVVEPDPPPWNPGPPKVVEVFPRGGRPPRSRTQFRRTGRPGKKVKERKIKAHATAARAILKIVNGITEGSDFVRALYKALPKKYQKRGALVMDQWKAVYQHWNELDVIHSIRSVARDQMEDMIYGKLGRISGKAANKRGGLYDPSGRAIRKLQNPDFNGDTFDPIDYVLDQIFGKDT